MKPSTGSYWLDGATKRFPALEHPLDVDVLIVGGGITGATAAYLVSGTGKKVALVERGLVCGRDTGHTTAHLTYMTDTSLTTLCHKVGMDAAAAAWHEGRRAMEFMIQEIRSQGIECGLEIVPGYLAAALNEPAETAKEWLTGELKLAVEVGASCEFTGRDPLTGRQAIHFHDQAMFHPFRYIDALLEIASGLGVEIFEDSNAVMEGESVEVNGHQVRAGKVFIATHVPLQGDVSTPGAMLFQTKLALYSSYALRAKLRPGDHQPMIWSDTEDPFYYYRVQKEGDHWSCVFGGRDHKTGQEDETNRHEELEERLQFLHPGAEVTHRWSGQVVETVDGLPYIGSISDRDFIATGFSGNGMTFGTLAALMFADDVNGKASSCGKFFDPGRKSLGAMGTFVSENSDFPVHMVKDRIGIADYKPEVLLPGQGCVMTKDGHKVAVSRQKDGSLLECSAVCPHLGCIVAWNPAESTWDCPCHGSRFNAEGKVLGGPAESDLELVIPG